jgi:hypothetical protein
MHKIPRALVNLLTATTVLAWSLAPPPIQHSHQGGRDLSHEHATAHAQHACQAAVEPDAISDDASDLHCHWLGFRLALPDGSPTKKGEDGGLSKLLFVQATRASLFQVHAGSRLDTAPALLPLNLAVADIAASRAPIFGSSSCVTSHPLCDRARHERSGVQLS